MWQCQSVLHMHYPIKWMYTCWFSTTKKSDLIYQTLFHVGAREGLCTRLAWGTWVCTILTYSYLFPMVYLSSSRMLVMSAQVIQLVNTRAHTQRRLRSVCVPFSLQLFWHEAAYKRYQRHQNTMYFLAAWQNSPWTTLWLQISSSGKWSGVLKGVHCCKLCLCVRQ